MPAPARISAPPARPAGGGVSPAPRPGLLRRALNAVVARRSRRTTVQDGPSVPGERPTPRHDAPAEAAVGRAAAVSSRPATPGDVVPADAPSTALEVESGEAVVPAGDRPPSTATGPPEEASTEIVTEPGRAADVTHPQGNRTTGPAGDATAALDTPRSQVARTLPFPSETLPAGSPTGTSSPAVEAIPEAAPGSPTASSAPVGPTLARRAEDASEQPAASPVVRVPLEGGVERATAIAPSDPGGATGGLAEGTSATLTTAGGATTTARARVARTPARPRTPAPTRPLLRAEWRPRSAAGPSGAPAVPATSGAHLARALALPMTPEPDGSVSISLGESPAPSTPLPLLARAPMGDAEMAPSPAPSPAPAPAPTAAPAGAPAPTIDEIYEQVIERLRHDLLVERERMGDLIGGLP
jgi:hypothetical protein